MKHYRRYQLSAGHYDEELYPIRKGKKRYPYVTPERLTRDLKITYDRNNKCLGALKRSRKWYNERRNFRKKWGIPEKGLSPRRLEAWKEDWCNRLYHERCSDDPREYVQLLMEFDTDMEEIAIAHHIQRIPFVLSILENYLLLNSRYYKYQWRYLSGYIYVNGEGKPEDVAFSPYYKVPHSLKRILIDTVTTNLPKHKDFVIETRKHPLGLAWRLIFKNSCPT